MSQMFPIPKYIKPNEWFCTFGPVFEEDSASQASLQRLFDTIDGQMFNRRIKFQNATVGNGGGEVNSEVRRSQVYFVEPSNDTEWLFHHVVNTVARVNGEKFDLSIPYLEALQYTLYQASENGTYHWHVDAHQNEAREFHRKLSFVIGLSDPEDYEGGDLLLNLGGNQEQPMAFRLKKGEAIFFYSTIPHTVTPVTKGERRTLVGWTVGAKLM